METDGTPLQPSTAVDINAGVELFPTVSEQCQDVKECSVVSPAETRDIVDCSDVRETNEEQLSSIASGNNVSHSTETGTTSATLQDSTCELDGSDTTGDIVADSVVMSSDVSCHDNTNCILVTNDVSDHQVLCGTAINNTVNDHQETSDETVDNTANDEQQTSNSVADSDIGDQLRTSDNAVNEHQPSNDAVISTIDSQKPSNDAVISTIDFQKPSIDAVISTIDSQKPSIDAVISTIDSQKPSIVSSKSVVESVSAANDAINNLIVTDVDCEVLSHRELKLSLSRLEQRFDMLRHLDRPPSVLIDLRHPKLVQVCTGFSSIDGELSTSCVARRPQTAVRGRRRHVGVITSSHVVNGSEPVNGHQAQQTTPHDDNTHNNSLNSETERLGESFGASTIIHLKFIDEPSIVDCNYEPTEQHFEQSAPNNSLKRKHATRDHNRTDSSDEDLMTVRNVNRTYTRNPVGPKQLTVRQTVTPKLAPKTRDVQSCPVADDYSPPTSPLSHLRSLKTPVTLHSRSKTSKPSTLRKQQKRRIGPAWFSRKFLSKAPRELWDHVRALKSFSVYKQANYVDGTRHRPISSRQATTRHRLLVPVSEQSDVSPVGQEHLVLWRMSEAEVDELQSQIRREADHRRSEHIMPLVMQLTDDQIEHVYEGVTESMKTYEIVAADSDEEEEEEDKTSEAVDDDVDDEYYRLMLDESMKLAAETKTELPPSVSDTDYTRNRPKRLAVDYGPSAFTPILMMEGRRVFEGRRKSQRLSLPDTKPAGEGVSKHKSRRLPGRRSQQRHRKSSSSSEQTVETSHTDNMAQKHSDNCIMDTSQLTVHKDVDVNVPQHDNSIVTMTTHTTERCGVFDSMPLPAVTTDTVSLSADLSSNTALLPPDLDIPVSATISDVEFSSEPPLLAVESMRSALTTGNE